MELCAALTRRLGRAREGGRRGACATVLSLYPISLYIKNPKTYHPDQKFTIQIELNIDCKKMQYGRSAKKILMADCARIIHRQEMSGWGRWGVRWTGQGRGI